MFHKLQSSNIVFCCQVHNSVLLLAKTPPQLNEIIRFYWIDPLSVSKPIFPLFPPHRSLTRISGCSVCTFIRSYTCVYIFVCINTEL